MRVINYFYSGYVANTLYIRELPVPVPTKFIENHRPIVNELLEVVLPEDRVPKPLKGKYAFERRWGLRWPRPLVRLRVLDVDIARDHLSGVSDLSMPVDAFNALRLPLKRVLILENKTSYDALLNFLTLPACTGMAAVFGSGFKVGTLKEATWLHDVELLYWGDLDAHGFQILHQARTYFPHIRSILMDRATLDAFAEYQVAGEATTVEHLPTFDGGGAGGV